jgi:hypothetical protein
MVVKIQESPTPLPPADLTPLTNSAAQLFEVFQ